MNPARILIVDDDHGQRSLLETFLRAQGYQTQSAASGEAALEIADNGPGVPAADRAAIFKPYVTMRPQGVGLGLAIVQQIVLAHGWTVACDANTPQGAIFRISHLKVARDPASVAA